ncbi:IstB-like ATP binding protein [Denitrobacterium detoxificans]|uniref:IstB-like ATP binding protein n=2 Tax=Denitrobacterium detoxificans TaxID=79604 RepID=A0A1H8SSS2_9ACTN|nr:IstB-like ATP binding protein [Denitrobacterium detoxificans]SEP01612.1 IstB-like ATP binding protein [Denitrobacterium detoxificans]
MASPMDAIVANAPKLCPHCGKALRRTTVVVRGRTYHPPCYGSCGCAASQRDMNPPKVGRTLEERCRRAGIPSRFLGSGLDVSAHLDCARRGEWLYVHGGSGEGKTAIAGALAEALVAAGDKVAFVGSVEAASCAIHDPERYEELRGCDYLVLDDLGKESDRDWAVRWMYELVNERYANRRWTCVTSNYDLAELAERMARAAEPKTAEAIASRLQECRSVQTDGWDWRAAR